MENNLKTFNELHISEKSVNEIIELEFSKMDKRPEIPRSPTLKNNHTYEEAFDYAEKLKEYIEVLKPKFQKEYGEWSRKKSEIESNITDFIKDVAGLNQIPKESQEKVWSRAWEDGHSDGYYEVYLRLCELTSLF